MDRSLLKSHGKKENPLVNISFNILIPSIIMTKFDDWFELNPTVALVLALAFPLSYGLFDLISVRKWNLFSCVGFFSIFITGSIGLLKLPVQWIPIKEATVPMIFCTFIALSMFNEHTLLEKFLFNENLLNAELIYSCIKTDEQKRQLRQIMLKATAILALSFVISSILNFILAKIIMSNVTNTAEFTKELGHMFALSYPVIVFPCTIVLYFMLHYIVKRLEKLTGLSINELLDIK